MIVVRSESSFSRGFMTDPNYREMDNFGNATLNWLTSAVFEGMVGMNENLVVSVNELFLSNYSYVIYLFIYLLIHSFIHW